MIKAILICSLVVLTIAILATVYRIIKGPSARTASRRWMPWE
ncbi:hypothetical protein ACPJHQ_07595 [Rossellomorea sp. H39__3]